MLTIYIGGNIGQKDSKEVEKDFNNLDKILTDLGHKVLNPRRKKDGDRAKIIREASGCIVHRDEQDIDRSDLMIAQLDSRYCSIGTPMEIYRCREIRKIPVIVITKDEYLKTHPWLTTKVSVVVSTIEEALEHVIFFDR